LFTEERALLTVERGALPAKSAPLSATFASLREKTVLLTGQRAPLTQ
jgi:hypothetical protein